MTRTVRAQLFGFALGGLLLGNSAGVLAQDSPQQPPPAADNTKVNERDQQKNQPTADSQKNSPSDRELARQIRKSLMNDKSLSTYAHNVKIIAQNGMVTLKGPVRSYDEKRAIEAKAAEVAGEKKKVTSMLEVTPSK